MEGTLATRPLPPATGRAAPPSALGKGRGPQRPPPPLASSLPFPFFCLTLSQTSSSQHMGVWTCLGEISGIVVRPGSCRQMATGTDGGSSLERPHWTYLPVLWVSQGLRGRAVRTAPFSPSPPLFIPLSSFFLCSHIPPTPTTPPSLHPHPSREAGERRRPLAPGAYGSGNGGCFSVLGCEGRAPLPRHAGSRRLLERELCD